MNLLSDVRKQSKSTRFQLRSLTVKGDVVPSVDPDLGANVLIPAPEKRVGEATPLRARFHRLTWRTSFNQYCTRRPWQCHSLGPRGVVRRAINDCLDQVTSGRSHPTPQREVSLERRVALRDYQSAGGIDDEGAVGHRASRESRAEGCDRRPSERSKQNEFGDCHHSRMCS